MLFDIDVSSVVLLGFVGKFVWVFLALLRDVVGVMAELTFKGPKARRMGLVVEEAIIAEVYNLSFCEMERERSDCKLVLTLRPESARCLVMPGSRE
jgi:hypothetical protein